MWTQYNQKQEDVTSTAHKNVKLLERAFCVSADR